MLKIAGYYWPDDVGGSWEHSLRHVKSLDFAIGLCKKRRTAVQAGGNMGLWPLRMAKSFDSVHTFEPEAVALECLRANVADAKNVTVHNCALGDMPGKVQMLHKGLGSHCVAAEKRADKEYVDVITVDSLGLRDVDLLQLDVEGYEWHAIIGALDTIVRCRPVIQLEYRNFTKRYGKCDEAIDRLLREMDYALVSRQPGSDVVYA